MTSHLNVLHSPTLVKEVRLNRPLRIGVNGFGRIGRCITKLAVDTDDIDIVAVNDLSDANNLIYLYNYDSTYGRANPVATLGPTGNVATFGDATARFHNEPSIADVPWDDYAVDVLVDASGVHDNVIGSRRLITEGKVQKVVLTHSPPDGEADRYVIMGVNDDRYDPAADHLVSNTICDANAIAHVLRVLDDRFGVEHGFVTTLHPWLSYQNLVDGPVGYQRFPGAYWDEYALGRSSVSALIPKRTTAVAALKPILPSIEERLTGFSFRTPTSIVSTADLSLSLTNIATHDEIKEYLHTAFLDSPYVKLNYEPLVSTDFIRETASAVIDMRWIQVSGDHMVKAVLWYDNEWGYSSRVIDLLRLLDPRGSQEEAISAQSSG